MGAIDAGHMRHGMGWTTDSPMGRYMTRSGFPQDDLIASFQNHPGFKFRPDRVVHYEPLHEGDLVEIGDYRLRVIDTPGHTEGHISLYDPDQRLFIAGDHVLGDITPNIQAWSDDDDPLADYLDSLEKVEGSTSSSASPAIAASFTSSRSARASWPSTTTSAPPRSSTCSRRAARATPTTPPPA